jgi:hypothetical protein
MGTLASPFLLLPGGRRSAYLVIRSAHPWPRVSGLSFGENLRREWSRVIRWTWIKQRGGEGLSPILSAIIG